MQTAKGGLVNRTHFNILKSIRNNYLSKIALKSGATYSYICNILKVYEEKGLVCSKIVGNKRFFSLTEKGERVKQNLFKIWRLLDECEKGKV